MKAIFVILILLVVCVVLFVTAIASPNASKWLQKRVDRLSKFGERKGDRKAGKFGDISGEGLRKARSAADASARSGRRVNKALTPDD